MDPATIGLIITSLGSVIAAIAAAYSTVRKNEVVALERRVEVLETDLTDERAAHKATRTEMSAALAAEVAAHRDTRKELATSEKEVSRLRKELAAAYERLRRCLPPPAEAA